MAASTIQIPLGYDAPSFYLPDTVSGNNLSFPDIKGDRATVVMFICNHCPYVIHVIQEMVSVAGEYSPQAIGFVAISSNDIVNYPQDSPERMTEFAMQHGFSFPYLYDEGQEVAKAYYASCTPDLSVFDLNGKCVYRGRFDSSNHKNSEQPTGKDLREVLEAILEHKPLSAEQYPSLGCGIKWKEG